VISIRKHGWLFFCQVFYIFIYKMIYKVP